MRREVPPRKADMCPMETKRDLTLDAWRGLAIVTMIGDHVAAYLTEVFVEQGTELYETLLLYRATIGRIAAFAFMLVSGYLLSKHQPSLKRIIQVAAVAAFVNVTWLITPMGLEAPDILILWLGAVLLAPLWKKHIFITLFLAYLQFEYWPISWGGYQPGLIVMLLALGVLLQRSQTHFPNLGSFTPMLGWVGRYPLTFYTVHLAAIWLFALIYIAV